MLGQFRVLIIIAVLLVIGVFTLAAMQKRKKAKREIPPLGNFEELDMADDIIEVRKLNLNDQGEVESVTPVSSSILDEGEIDIDLPETAPEPTEKANSSLNDMVILNIFPPAGEDFSGLNVMKILLSNGLRFGDMDIFHYHEDRHGKGPVLFSIAQATQPGTFDINAMGSTHCNGLTLFCQPSLLENGKYAVQQFINTAHHVAEELGGMVLDNQRQPLSQDSLSALKRGDNYA